MASNRVIGIAGALLAAGIASGCSNFSSQARTDGLGAVTGLNQAVEIGEQADPTPEELEVRRANLLLTQADLAKSDGDSATAIRRLESILELDAHHAEAAHRLGVLYVESGNLEAAEKKFQVALSREQPNARLHCDYGYFCYLTGRWEDAKKHLTRATELDANLKAAHTNLGMLEARQGNLASARRHFESAGCSQAEILSNEGLANLLELEIAEAKSKFDRAAALDSENPQIQRGRDLTVHLSRRFAMDSASSAKTTQN